MSYLLPLIMTLFLANSDKVNAVDIKTLLSERVNSTVAQIVFDQKLDQKVSVKNCNFWRNLLRLHLKNEEEFCKDSIRSIVSKGRCYYRQRKNDAF